MKRYALIFSLILICTTALPRLAHAGDEAFISNAFRIESDPVIQVAGPFEFQVQNKLLRKLIDQKITYHLDEASSLRFSCNLANLAGKLELVVKF